MSELTKLFEGQEIVLAIEATRHSPAQAEAIRKTISSEPPQKLRYNCLVADALNKALNGGENGTHVDEYQDLKLGAETFRLNPRARSQFGMDYEGTPYLTTSLIHVDTGVRYAFTWRGDNVPYELKHLAVRHDQGKATPDHLEVLKLDEAEIHIIGEKHPGQKERAERDKRIKRNHDPNAPIRMRRPTHKRICERDLAREGDLVAKVRKNPEAPKPKKKVEVAAAAPKEDMMINLFSSLATSA